ncbi:MAG: hypothetical protein DRI57_32535, partial [Deltaproteobacteria bacterium]
AGFVNPAEAVMGRSAGIGRSESFLPDLSIRQEQLWAARLGLGRSTGIGRYEPFLPDLSIRQKQLWAARLGLADPSLFCRICQSGRSSGRAAEDSTKENIIRKEEKND